MLGISTTNARVGGFRGKGLSAEAIAWQANIIANGGTITPAKLAFFDTWFFKPAKTAGNILTELDRLNIYCNLVGFEIAARTNMIKAAHFVTPVSSPTFDNNGYRSSGTGYLNLNYNPNSQGVKYTQNSAITMFGVLNPQFNANRWSIGCESAAQANISRIRRGNGFMTYLVNRSTGATGSIYNTAAISGKVSIGAIRKTSNSEFVIINGIEYVGSTNPSVAPPNFSSFELTINVSGVPDGQYDTESHLFSLHGSSNLNVSGLQTILNNLYSAAGI